MESSAFLPYYPQFCLSRTFNREQLEALISYLCKNDKDAMDLILLYEPERIHTLVPGVLLLRCLMDQYGAQAVTVSHYGVREGYENAGVLEVFPIFHTARWGQKIRRIRSFC